MQATNVFKCLGLLCVATLLGVGAVSLRAQSADVFRSQPDVFRSQPTGNGPGFFYDNQNLNERLNQNLNALAGSELGTLLEQFQAADSESARDSLKSKLNELLGKQFDARQKGHEKQIADLEAQVTKLRELVKKRQTSRSEIISLRLEQMLRETQGLGW
jgi:hypothetical protein